MAREGITFEQVAAAAAALVSQGKQPTIKAIREELGTGSPNTVHRHLMVWREARPEIVTSASVLPESVAVAVAAAIERAASQARAEVEVKFVQAQAEAIDLAAAGEALEADLATLAEQVTELTTERDILAGRAAQLAADLAAHTQQIEREQAASEAARLEAATSRVKAEAVTGTVHTALDQAHARLEQLTGLLDCERAERIAATAAAAQATIEAAVLTEKLEIVPELKAEVTELRAALDTQAKARSAAEQHGAVLAVKLEASSKEVADLRTRLEVKGEKVPKSTPRS